MVKLKKVWAIVLVWSLVLSSFTIAGNKETIAMDKEFKDSVVASRDGNIINLEWIAKDSADGYEIYRSEGRYADFSLIGSTNDTEYTDAVSDSVYKYYYKVVAKAGNSTLEESEVASMDQTLWGDSVDIFSAADNKNKINERIKSISEHMMKASDAEWSDERYALMFKPGEYDINKINVGFYTQVLGLGKTPYETSIPNINVDSAANGNVLINFWRGIENIAVDTGSKTAEVKWGASQAAPIRRLYVNGKLHLDDIGLPASGGFVADTYVTGQTGSWSQQQFYLRNNNMADGWYDGVWNIMFQGCVNAPNPSADWANTSYKGYTVEEKTDVVREKPFVYMDQGEYKVFVPGLRYGSSGVSWSRDNMGEGRSIDIEDFYIAKPGDDADEINAALSSGLNIIFTPGVYRLDKALNVEEEGTVVLGLGLATLICDNTDTALNVSDEEGITIAGLVIEAGANGSESLIKVGESKNNETHDNPILMSDVFTRVGGARTGKVKSAVVINANDVIGDHFWLWRADHGTGASWNGATADNGLVVNGDNVSVHGLFVEHFQKYQTLWNGENGRTYFYQCELPYDVPTQDKWMSDREGYAAYKVNDSVQAHSAKAMGVYEVFVHTDGYVKLANAIEVPESADIVNACTVSLGNVNGEITHIVNDKGDPVGSSISVQGQKVGLNKYPVDDRDQYRTGKKGVSSWYYASGSNAAQRNVGLFNNLGANWIYNWGATDEVAAEAKEAGIEYVPMTWGKWSVNDSEMNRLKAGKENGLYDCLLAFNEPDLSDQSNMTVDEAIALWPKLESTGLRLGSPAGAAVEDQWVSEFMEKANEKGYRVDFLTLHVYQDFTHPSSVASLKAALERLHNKYNLPIWITEIGNVDVSTQWWGYNLYQEMSHDVARKYISEVGEMLESLDYVERYAWFVDYSDNITGTAYTRLFDISDDSLTPEGEAYRGIRKKEVEPTTEAPTSQTTVAPTTKQTTTQPTTQLPSVTTSVTSTPESGDVNTGASDVTNKVAPKTLKRVKIKKIYRKKKSAKKLKLKVVKVKAAKGYQVAVYKTKKKAKKNKKALFKKYIKKNKAKLVVKSKKLKNKKKLFVRVRAYLKENGTVTFGKWSKIKTVR